MAKDTKRKEPTPEELAEQKAEGAALQKIFMQRKRDGWTLEGEKLTQASLGYRAGKITQGAVSHFFSGRTRLSAESALQFAELLGATVAGFSPRLAIEIEALAKRSAIAQAPPDTRARVKATVRSRENQHRALEKLSLLNEEQAEAWLNYADFLISQIPPAEAKGSG